MEASLGKTLPIPGDTAQSKAGAVPSLLEGGLQQEKNHKDTSNCCYDFYFWPRWSNRDWV